MTFKFFAAVAVMFLAGPVLAAPNYFYAEVDADTANSSGSHGQNLNYENNIGPNPPSGPPNTMQSANSIDTGGASAASSVSEASVLLQAMTTPAAGETGYNVSENAYADLRYTIDVSGGPTPVTFQALLQTGGAGSPSNFGIGPQFESTAAFLVDYAYVGEACTATILDGCGSIGAHSLNLDAVISLAAGSHTVEEWVRVLSEQGGSASGSADPRIFVDPAFLTKHPGYGVSVPSGVGGAPSAAPEPGAWALMLGGVAAVGAALATGATFGPPWGGLSLAAPARRGGFWRS